MEKEYEDYPFEDAINKADVAVSVGGTVFQKFTCESCGQRLTIDVPNTFHTEGSCDKCGHVTDITKRGCNFLALFKYIADDAKDEKK